MMALGRVKARSACAALRSVSCVTATMPGCYEVRKSHVIVHVVSVSKPLLALSVMTCVAQP